MTENTTKSLLMNLQWLYSVGVKIFRVIPIQTIVTTAFTLISQVTLLFAFLLPIKVLILLGSENIPGYFPDFLSLLERDLLIVALAATSICSYLIHLLCDTWTDRLGTRGTERILARTRKFEFLENQTNRARRAYVQYTQGFAALVFLLVGMIALALVYPLIAMVVGGVCVLAILTAFLRQRFDKDFREDVFAQLPEYSKRVANLIFLSVFLVMVGDYLRGDPPSLLIGIIVLILVRQWSSRSVTLVSHGTGLVSRRVEVSTLFFHSQTAALGSSKREPALWQMVRSLRIESDFAEVLAATEFSSARVLESRWIQTGNAGIAAFLLRLEHADTRHPKQLLVKLYAKQRQTYANNEFTLMTTPRSERLPTLRMIGATSLEGLSCHIFDAPDVSVIPIKDRPQAIADFRCTLSAVPLSADFLDKYHRSHPGLWLRVDTTVLDRLKIVSNETSQADLLDRFRELLPGIQALLKNMPESLVNAEATRQNLRLDENAKPVSLNWGRWSVDPVGSSWPVDTAGMELIDQVHEELVQLRSTFKTLPVEHVKIAAFIWEFERLFLRELYEDCLVPLETAMDLIEEVADLKPELARQLG